MRKLLVILALLFASTAEAQEIGPGGRTSKLNITAATVVKTGTGRVATISVTVAGAVGTVSDTTTTGTVAAGNLIAVIPAVVGVYRIDWPVLLGIVVTPGAAQVVSVSYE